MPYRILKSVLLWSFVFCCNFSQAQHHHESGPTGTSLLTFSLDQYLIGIKESGPLGRTTFTAPNMFMLHFEQIINTCDSVRVEWMGTTDLWTTPKTGTPQLLQVGDGFVNFQHPHSTPVMGLTFAEVHCLTKSGERKIILSFSPRGSATLGPQNFMDRMSAQGNPIVPLSHHMQDLFHIMSTVLAARFESGRWTIEASVFSGMEQNPKVVNLDTHIPDSFGIRVERKIGKSLRIGGSAGSILQSHDNNSLSSHRQGAISAWVLTDNKFSKGTLATSNIWGQYGEDRVRLNSFLSEMVFRFGEMEKKRIFSRFEVLQRTPEQLEIQVTGDGRTPEWIKKLMVGFRKEFDPIKGATYSVGGSVGQSFIPTSFQVVHNGNPISAEIDVLIQFKKSVAWDGEFPVPASVRSKFGWIYTNIIGNKCLSCHSEHRGHGDGLEYANFDSYTNLMEKVVPRDPEASILYRVVMDKKMPKSEDETKDPNFLKDKELEAIYAWIKAGAKNN